MNRLVEKLSTPSNNARPSYRQRPEVKSPRLKPVIARYRRTKRTPQKTTQDGPIPPYK